MMHENISFCVIENRMQRKRSFRCAICFVIICCAKSSLISPWLSSNDKKKKKIRLLELAWIELYGNMDETAVDEKGR